MTTHRDARQAPLDAGPGSDSDPHPHQRDTYGEPTVVPYGLSGFTEGMQDAPWEEAAPHYRRVFEEQQGVSGRRWEEAEPGIRYAHEMRADAERRGRSWSEVEPDLRSSYSDWSRERGYSTDDGAWERVKTDAHVCWDLDRKS